ncbi:unnamed protein product [Thelazia callipaeda]|uniref:Zinc finger C2HC domain-containing protein 1A n=1 Tax=Thelazia callipaeda TaxID=103827 RepID=A0A0N5CJH8_THECL|nr:unnamed protein product [Thelazia callipaeda]
MVHIKLRFCFNIKIVLQLKHEPVCQRMTKVKRKVFDSGRQRATGSDITIENVRNARKEREKLGGTFPRPQTGWRERHETFVTAVSSSKTVTETPSQEPAKTLLPKGYVKCEYCGRSFNDAASQRHIPFCKTQHDKMKASAKVISTGTKFSATSNMSQKSESKKENQVTIRNARQLSVDIPRKNRSNSKKPKCHQEIPVRRSSVFSRRSEPSVHQDSPEENNGRQQVDPSKKASPVSLTRKSVSGSKKRTRSVVQKKRT